ncbi:MAG TPA: efflux RND transporter periplasmic adaptor subunit [Gemmatimonadaceae bacterium]|nr:efflux RND transporter periplasmic adaptor subunit [Gemmatimonadaceae bacterium]
MTTPLRHFRLTILAAALLTTTQACKQDDAVADAAETAAASDMSVGPENIAVVKAEEIRTGPALSGSLSAETQSTVRAEVSGAVLQTLVEVGAPVRQGQDLARIDDSGIRDSYISARSGVTTADNTLQIAEREVQRAEALSKAGAIADRQRDQARNQLVAAQSMAADARARLANAQKQLEKTVIKAPFAGVVSARTINAGDFVSPGAATFTIINPSTMRLEASVSAEALSAVRLGVPVEFQVNGYGARRFVGRITSINPVADPATRQVRVIATIPNQGGTLVSGLFAEGRVASEAHTAPVVPAGAVDERGVRPSVMRLKGGKVEKAEVTLGIRDMTTETVEIRSGLAPGDTVLLGAARGISAGTKVKVSSPTDRK